MSRQNPQTASKEKKEARENTRREKLADFIYSLAKLVFGGVVVTPVMAFATGQILDVWLLVYTMVCGVIITYIFAYSANKILTN